jgi:parvulin-like peptidyl-prolyl isomerase
VSWEIIFFNFMPDFAEKYAASVIQKMQASGASVAAVAAKQKEMSDFQRLYANPLINVGMTFLEIFPVGLIVTLVSAAILRRKNGRVTGEPAVVAG